MGLGAKMYEMVLVNTDKLHCGLHCEHLQMIYTIPSELLIESSSLFIIEWHSKVQNMCNKQDN